MLVQKELSDRPSVPGAISQLHLELYKENACLAEAIFTVQTGDDLGFNLRNSLKSALSSTASSPGGSISRRQRTKPGPIWKAVAIWGTIQGVLADRQSQLGNDDYVGVSMLHANHLSQLTIFNLLSFNEASQLSKESWYLVEEGPCFSFQYSTDVAVAFRS